MDKAMLEVWAEWWKTKGPSCGRILSGKQVKCRSDLIFYKGEEMIRIVQKVKLLSDYWCLLVDVEVGHSMESVDRIGVD